LPACSPKAAVSLGCVVRYRFRMFRIAHVSDPHLGPLPEPRFRELMSKRVLGYLNWRLHRGGAMRPAVLDGLVADLRAHTPDHVCVTGDIVNIALDAELEPARQWLAELGAPAQVSLVPGNHDAYVKGALKRASAVWGAHLFGDGFDHVKFPYVRRRGPLAIVGASSAYATGPFMATGQMDASQALLLSEALQHAGREGLFRVVMIHHPPTIGSAHWAGRLIGASRFRAAVREAGAELVLHGHTHQRSLDWIEGRDGAVPVLGVPSASASPGLGRVGATWNRLDIDGAPGRWTINLTERGYRAPSGAIETIDERVIGPPGEGVTLNRATRKSRRRL
jgi:3',5'-cyclic AMP phosphodiesterase CpdA